MNNQGFLIDANCLITPFRDYYSTDLIPTFWDEFAAKGRANGNLFLLDMVKNEIDKGDE